VQEGSADRIRVLNMEQSLFFAVAYQAASLRLSATARTPGVLQVVLLAASCSDLFDTTSLKVTTWSSWV
jgi:hypothetical protein